MTAILNQRLIAETANDNLMEMRLLINQGANIDSRDSDNWTPLHYACHQGKPDSASFLVKSGANLNVQDNTGETPLMKSLGNQYKIKLLIKNGADINIQNNDGDTALIKAVNFSYSRNVIALLRANADINLVNKKGQSALDVALDRSNQELIDLLTRHYEQVELDKLIADNNQVQNRMEF